MGIEIVGEEAVAADMNALAKDLNDIPMEDVSAQYVAITSSMAPRRTGYLANSIRPSNGENIAGASANTRYAHIVNYGSPKRGMSPTRFMNRADNIMDSQLAPIVEEGVDELIKNRGLGP